MATFYSTFFAKNLLDQIYYEHCDDRYSQLSGTTEKNQSVLDFDIKPVDVNEFETISNNPFYRGYDDIDSFLAERGMDSYFNHELKGENDICAALHFQLFSQFGQYCIQSGQMSINADNYCIDNNYFSIISLTNGDTIIIEKRSNPKTKPCELESNCNYFLSALNDPNLVTLEQSNILMPRLNINYNRHLLEIIGIEFKHEKYKIESAIGQMKLVINNGVIQIDLALQTQTVSSKVIEYQQINLDDEPFGIHFVRKGQSYLSVFIDAEDY
jgi:hypothetical protein